MFYNYFRDYDASTGRYVESDSIELAAGVNTYSYVNGNAVSYFDPMGLMGGGGNHAPSRNYVPDRECMSVNFSNDLGPFATLGKEFSAFSLFSNDYNIDNHWMHSFALSAAGTAGKFGAYRYLSQMPQLIPQLGAKSLHFFGEVFALPLTAAATVENAIVADRCKCQEIKNPGAWARARELKKEMQMWENFMHRNVPTGPVSPIGFLN